jgi:hypothetical protein
VLQQFNPDTSLAYIVHTRAQLGAAMEDRTVKEDAEGFRERRSSGVRKASADDLE